MQASKNARPQGPVHRADCALSNLVEMGGKSVCFGAGAIHNAHCPQARQEMRARVFWGRVYQATILVWGIGLLLALIVGFWLAR